MHRTWHPLLAVILLAGCPKGGGDTQAPVSALEAPPPKGPPIEQPGATGTWTREDVDLNNDGVIDAVNWKSGSALARKDTDLNQDGRMDVVSYYGATGALEKELMDGDFDGKMDWVDVYQAGTRVRADVDTDHDGKVDTIFHYENGQIVKKERMDPV